MDGFVGGSFSYQSATNSGLGEIPLFALKAHTVIDARLGVKAPDDQWRASLFVRNLTDKVYYTFRGIPGGVEAAVGYTGLPRTYGVNLSVRY